MRMSIKPKTSTSNLTCNFLLKYEIYSLLIFPIEMSPWFPFFPVGRDKGLVEYVFEMRMSNLTLLNLKFPVEMSPWLPLLSC